jgi:hypothetical protein
MISSLASQILELPYLKLEFPVTVDQFKIVQIGGDQAGTVSACRERDEDIEVQVAQLARGRIRRAAPR